MISVNIVVNVVVLVSSGITLNCIRQFFRVIIHLLGKTYQQTMYGLIRTKALVLPRFFFFSLALFLRSSPNHREPGEQVTFMFPSMMIWSLLIILMIFVVILSSRLELELDSNRYGKL